MKIALVSSYVPFVEGGARFIVEWLQDELVNHGHQVERFYLPFIDVSDDMFDQIAAYRLMDLTQACDRLIAFRPPSYVIRHPNKVLWFIHHIRVFYDLWDSPYRPMPDSPDARAIRQALFDLDTVAIGEAQKVFTNSQVVANRLKRFNAIDARPLYPPILHPERFRNDGYGDEIVAITRIEPHKRPQLLVEAMRYVRTPVKLRICGQSSNPAYAKDINRLIDRIGARDRVIFEDRWISEQEKVEYLAGALAVAYLPIDEDSYGYPSLEAAHAGKGVMTAMDSGGVLELVEHGKNGLVCEPTAQAIAAAMDQLYSDRSTAKSMGEANAQRVKDLKIDWQTVVSALTS